MDKNLFLNGYLDALSARLAHYLPPNEFVRHLLGATYAMIDNTDPRRSNQEVFMEQFFTRTGLPPEEILPIFDRFYREEFPSLSRLTRPTPLARRVVSAALENGLTLAVATNAIFPRAAIEERLHWAGVADMPFRVITSYEIMHFCKPKPQYYEEIAALLGAEPEECLMVGNTSKRIWLPPRREWEPTWWRTTLSTGVCAPAARTSGAVLKTCCCS